MASDKSRSIPSLDGLRAVSIALVLADHSIQDKTYWFKRIPALFFLANGGLGVSVFFVISGFLITRLLIKELAESNDISLKRFYLRRSLRIFPAFYLYVAVVGIAWMYGLIPEQPLSFLNAATYTWNYGHGGYWFFGHTWSLSLEEQFYLLWPLCLMVLGLRRGRWFAVALISLSPISRVGTYFLLPAWRGHIGMMLHTRLDTIMFGCLLALLYDNAQIMSRLDRFLRPSALASATAFLFFLDPILESQFRGYYSLPVGLTLQAISVSFVLLYVVRKPASIPGHFLNLPVVRHIGVISYGLYLWQQFFTFPGNHLFPLNILASVACAEISYRMVERPILRMRDRLEEKVGWRIAPVLVGPSSELAKV
jgi:peptidoglycan/LPS O-acetylase OafA/YrhL